MHDILPSGDIGFDDPIALTAYPEDSQMHTKVPLHSSEVLAELAEYWRDEYSDSHERMSIEEEEQLAEIIQEGLAAEAYIASRNRITAQKSAQLQEAVAAGRRAQQALVEANLQFAMYYARVSTGRNQAKSQKRFMDAQKDFAPEDRQRYVGTFSPLHSLKTPNQSLEDRYSMAFMGLIKAARGYKPTAQRGKRRIKFVSYAAWHIQECLTQGVMSDEHTGIRLPQRQWQQLRHYFGNHPKVGEGHQIPDDIQQLIEMTSINAMPEVRPTSHGSPEELRDEWNEDDVPTDFSEIWDDPNKRTDIYRGIARVGLLQALDTLGEREIAAVAGHHGLIDGEVRTLDEIGSIFGVSRERIRQIESKAMSKLRHPHRSKHLAGISSLIDNADSDYPTIRRGDSSAPQTPDRWESGSVFTRNQTYETHELNPESEEATIKNERETWQAYADEPWELPERKGSIMPDEKFEATLDIIEKAAPFMYTNRYVEQAKTPYPVLTIEKLHGTIDGHVLSGEQVSALWDTYLGTTYIKLQEELGDTFNTGRVGQLFSRIIEEFTTVETDMITLSIPEEMAGKIHNLASSLTKGNVKIVGNPGDFVAANNSGYSSVYVEGSCGAGAGLRLKGNATLYVLGTVGKLSGITDETTTEIIVEGQDL